MSLQTFQRLIKLSLALATNVASKINYTVTSVDKQLYVFSQRAELAGKAREVFIIFCDFLRILLGFWRRCFGKDDLPWWRLIFRVKWFWTFRVINKELIKK